MVCNSHNHYDADLADSPLLISDSNHQPASVERFKCYAMHSNARIYVIFSAHQRNIDIFHRDFNHFILSEDTSRPADPRDGECPSEFNQPSK